MPAEVEGPELPDGRDLTIQTGWVVRCVTVFALTDFRRPADRFSPTG